MVSRGRLNDRSDERSVRETSTKGAMLYTLFPDESVSSQYFLAQLMFSKHDENYFEATHRL